MLRREQSRFPGKRKETMLNRNMRNTPFIGVVEPEAAEDAEEGAEQVSGEEKGDNVE